MTFFIGRIGNDAFGKQMMERLTKEGIKTSNVIIDPDAASGVAIILIDSQGQNMISVAPGANEKLAKEDLKTVKEIIEKANVVVLQMEIRMEVIREIINTTFQSEIMSVLNPAPFKEIPLEVLKKVDIITPNENELFQLYKSLGFNEQKKIKKKNLSKVTKDLHSLGINTIIVTLGEKGCFVSDSKNGEQFYIPAIEVTAIDTVGAGDALFALASLFVYSKTDPELIPFISNCAGGLAANIVGNKESITKNKLMDFIEKLLK